MQFLEVGAELGETKELGVCVGAFFEAFHMAENGVVRGNRDPHPHCGRWTCHGQVPQAAARVLASRVAQNSPAY